MAAKLAAQTDLIRKLVFDFKINKTKYLLVENELKKLQKFDAAYFRCKSHFEEDGTQNYLVFQPMYRYLKGLQVLVKVIIYTFGNLKVLSDEKLDSITGSNHKITPELSFYGTKTRVEFNGSCLKQGKVTLLMEQ